MEMDPGTAIVLGAGIYLAKDLTEKALGPTAEYLGEGLKKFTEKRAKNLKRIFDKFIDKLGQRIEEPGQVPPTILKGLISEGSFCEDELSVEYFAGLMASSRSGISRDDRGKTYIELISRLSTYQIRTHFIIYTLFKRFFVGKALNPGAKADRDKMRIYIPYTVYNNAMAFDENEDEGNCFLHSILGLNREDIVNLGAYGNKQNLYNFYPKVEYPGPGFLVGPTLSGMELYIWVHGLGNVITIHEFLDSDELALAIPQNIEIPTGAFSIEDKGTKE